MTMMLEGERKIWVPRRAGTKQTFVIYFRILVKDNSDVAADGRGTWIIQSPVEYLPE
jgi:hypothetical protein